MKKNLLFCLMTSIAILAVSCTKEQETDIVRLGKVEFNASISQDAVPESKVEIGTLEDGKAKLFFQKEDKIKLVYASGAYDAKVTYVTEAGIATIVAESAPVDETITEAWYPGDLYDNGEMNAPSIQQHADLPVILKGSLQGEELLFNADEGFTFISYPLTGTLQIKEAYLYFRDTPDLFSAYNEICPCNYTLRFDTPLQLTEDVQYLHFVVPTGVSKVVTLEVKTPAPNDALVADYKLLRRKTTAVDFTNGKAKVMPVMNFSESDIAIDNKRWAGEELLGKTGIIQDRSANGENSYELDGNKVKCTLYNTIYKTAGLYEFKTFNMYLKYNLITDTYVGNHRYIAIKSNVVHAFNNLGEGFTPMTTPGWDFRLSNNESSPATKSFQFTREKVKHLKSGEIDCGNGVMITYFDMLQEFSSYCFPTTNSSIGTKGTYFVQKIKYKGADGNQLTNDALPDIVCDIYWIGFFNSVEEIEAYEASLQ